jgi:2-hydroxy-3-oxopropionate reductase
MREPSETLQVPGMTMGWIGVGNMGAPMLQRLLDHGHDVYLFDLRDEAVRDLRPAAGAARQANSVAELTAQCDVVFLSLPSIAAVREVVLSTGGLLVQRGRRRLKTIVNTSTTGASLSRELCDASAPMGVSLVDCPVSGGPKAAQEGVLAVMVSGCGRDIDALRPLLVLFGKSIIVAGEAPGAAQTLKLVNNAIIVASYVSTLEAFLFGAKAGLSASVMLDAINAGRLAHNGTSRVWLPDYILQDKPFGAELGLLMKDMGLAMAESDAVRVPMWVCESALQVAKRACHGGLDEGADLMDLMSALEAGCQFRLPRARQAP